MLPMSEYISEIQLLSCFFGSYSRIHSHNWLYLMHVMLVFSASSSYVSNIMLSSRMFRTNALDMCEYLIGYNGVMSRGYQRAVDISE